NEVNNILTFLEAIDNPYNDVALLSVLRQPYVCSYIDMNTIADIRLINKDIPLYENLRLSDKPEIVHFLTLFDELRNDAFSTSPYDLTKKIYTITEYPLFVSRLINGRQRKANLDLLLEIIKQNQEKSPYLHDLLSILRNSSDYAPAQSSSGEQDVVEFMTIHKSKGLEFPVVFVCNMYKQFNTQDSKERIMIDKRLGVAIKPRMKSSTKELHDITVEYENCYRNMIARRQLDESINEEMRILYVALTRAVDKLIMTGVVKSVDELAAIQEKICVNESPDIYHRKGAGTVLLYERLRKTNNYLSWVLSAILRHPHVIEQCLSIDRLKHNAQLLKRYSFEKLLSLDSTEHAMFSLQLTDDQAIEKNIPAYTHETVILNNTIQDHYHHFVYPYDIEKTDTLAVTKLQAIEDDHFLSLSNEYESSLMSASDKGTLIHLFMSSLSFQQDNVSQLIQQLYQEKLCDEDGMQVLLDYQDKLQLFINSSYYEMISQASYVYKEKSFSYFDKERQQTIHGIFDLVFVYQNEIYVLDYKTDRISAHNSDQDLMKKHQVQLNYYQKVLKEMYKKDVHAIVYYLHISKGIEF
ncbi:MAG: 3'-5' exonuclease, partial [Coprobacillus sp.]